MEETQIDVLGFDAKCLLLFKIFTNASLHAHQTTVLLLVHVIYHQNCYSMIESAFVLLSKDKSV